MSKIRKSARGEQCTVRYWWVNYHDPATVVFAHSNKQKHGKGIGLKAKDEFGAYACYHCHAIYDGAESRPAGVTKHDVDAIFESAMAKTRVKLVNKGLLHETK